MIFSAAVLVVVVEVVVTGLVVVVAVVIVSDEPAPVNFHQSTFMRNPLPPLKTR